jgi:hypothetical protein
VEIRDDDLPEWPPAVTDKKCHFTLRILAESSKSLPRKVMVVGYLAETKGVVGC